VSKAHKQVKPKAETKRETTFPTCGFPQSDHGAKPSQPLFMNSEESTFSKARDYKEGKILSIATYLGVGVLFGMIVLGAIFLLRCPCTAAKPSQVNADFKSLQNALDLYKLEGGSYPTTAQGLKALVEKPAIEPLPARWQQIMTSEPLDPWKTPYRYMFPGSKDPTKPELTSAGPDGHFGNEDDVSSQDE